MEERPFGNRAKQKYLYVSEGQDFVLTLELPLSHNAIPVGTTAELKFGATTWTGTVAARTVKFVQESATTTLALIPDKTKYALWLHIPREGGGTDDFKWYKGTILRDD